MKRPTRKKITLVASKEKSPEVTLRLRPGLSFEMVDILPATPDGKPDAGRAALCGYGDACLALVDVGAIDDE
ncbi:MAG: hypothetical protein H6742_15910 [Alphaproteobacteria bacterium]|nr:hypothetical protein [Alphaproteobacteria bacterium]